MSLVFYIIIACGYMLAPGLEGLKGAWAPNGLDRRSRSAVEMYALGRVSAVLYFTFGSKLISSVSLCLLFSFSFSFSFLILSRSTLLYSLSRSSYRSCFAVLPVFLSPFTVIQQRVPLFLGGAGLGEELE